MRLPQESSETDGPNLTPVIDVVFLLLIFFLVATRYEQEEKEVDIDLPEATTGQPITMTPELVININSKGQYTVVRKRLTKSQLKSLIAQAKKANPQRRALIRGDSDAALKHAILVMDYCNQADMTYKIATAPKS